MKSSNKKVWDKFKHALFTYRDNAEFRRNLDTGKYEVWTKIAEITSESLEQPSPELLEEKLYKLYDHIVLSSGVVKTVEDIDGEY